MSTTLKTVFLFLLFVNISFAQSITESIISPDRPGGTVGPAKLDKGVLNFELGANFSSFNDKDNNESNAQNYAGIFRYGLLDLCEVNIGLAYNRENGGELTGIGPVTLGVKLAVAEEKGWFPQVEFEGKLNLAKIGNEAFIPKDVEPLFNFNFANHISDKTILNYHLGMFWESAEEAAYYGLMLSQQLGQRFTGFIEHYGFVRGDFDGEAHLGIGMLYLVNNSLQFDLRMDYGADDEETTFFVEFGISAMLAKGKSRISVLN